MYTNILIPTDGSELAGKAVEHGIALAKRIGAKVTVADCLAALSYVYDRHADDRGYTGSVQGTHAKASRENPWRGHPRRAGSGRRMRGRPGRARASLPGDHRYRGFERLRSNRHGFARPPRHLRNCPRQRDGKGPYTLQNPGAGPALRVRIAKSLQRRYSTFCQSTKDRDRAMVLSRLRISLAT